MQWAVSDLAFGGFNKKYLSGLPLTYNIEFFYEFGIRPLLGYGIAAAGAE